MEIKQITSKNEIENLLKEFDKDFTAGLLLRIDDLSKYAEKLFLNAINKVAIENNQIVGFICFYCNDTEKKIAYITQLCVKNTFRNKGIGSELISDCIEYCKNLKMKILKLEVANTNKNAFHFYMKKGFVIDKKLLENNGLLLQLNI